MIILGSLSELVGLPSQEAGTLISGYVVLASVSSGIRPPVFDTSVLHMTVDNQSKARYDLLPHVIISKILRTLKIATKASEEKTPRQEHNAM